MRFKDHCFRLMVAGLAFTSIFIFPLLGGSLIWRLVSAIDFLVECSRNHSLEKCSDIWKNTREF